MNAVNAATIEEYQTLLLAMQDVLGVVITEEKRDLISERIGRVMRQYDIASLTELAERIRANSDHGLNTLILEVLSEHDNSWNHQADLARLLNMYILPSFADNGRKKFRIWVAGCGRGQLSYSIAMHIAEYQQSHTLNAKFEVIATDVSAADIELAKNANYDATMLEGLPAAWQKKYMKTDNGGWTVKPAIRDMVKFATCDLLLPVESMGHFDLIICSDVLIYFSASIRSQILEDFARLLDPSGILVVGSSEAVMPFSQSYTRVAHEAGVFYRQISH
jgi:chemotaxis protein methyltransferase CheR